MLNPKTIIELDYQFDKSQIDELKKFLDKYFNIYDHEIEIYKAEDYAKQLGVDFVCVSADDDVTKQNNDINDMISSGIDALILNPINAEGVAPAIEACQKADIPVITVDRNVNDGNTAYVGRDNEEMGRLVGEALVEELGGKDKAEGKILEIQGTAGDTVMMARRDGFEAAIAEAPGLE